jgi:hypothetical protein
VERHVWAILPVEKVSPRLLAAWAKARAQAQRIVAPTVSVLGRSGLFAEDIVISTAMSVEALGSRLGPVANEPASLAKKRPTTAYFFRAIVTSGVDCSPIASSGLELARALADIYNTIKHADRGNFPDGLHTHYAGAISLLIVRLATIRFILGADLAVREYASGWRSQRLFDDAKSDRLAVKSGKFETLP